MHTCISKLQFTCMRTLNSVNWFGICAFQSIHIIEVMNILSQWLRWFFIFVILCFVLCTCVCCPCLVIVFELQSFDLSLNIGSLDYSFCVHVNKEISLQLVHFYELKVKTLMTSYPVIWNLPLIIMFQIHRIDVKGVHKKCTVLNPETTYYLKLQNWKKRVVIVIFKVIRTIVCLYFRKVYLHVHVTSNPCYLFFFFINSLTVFFLNMYFVTWRKSDAILFFLVFCPRMY